MQQLFNVCYQLNVKNTQMFFLLSRSRLLPGDGADQEGKLELRFYDLVYAEVENVTLHYKPNSPTAPFQLKSLTIDVKSREINVDASTYQLAENIALAYAIGILHIVCTRRPDAWTEGKEFTSPFSVSTLVTSSGLYTDASTWQRVVDFHGEKRAPMCGGGSFDCSKCWHHLPA